MDRGDDRGLDLTRRHHRAGVVVGVLVPVLVLVAACSSQSAAQSGATPTSSPPVAAAYRAAATLTGPVTDGHVIEPLSAHPLDLTPNGYLEEEFFASGTATAFSATSSPSNGRWSIRPASSAPYRTRILVRRPIDPSRFRGTVVVEWMNVSAGESAPDWDYLNPLLMRAGDAYVAVSAQSLGVDGGTPILGSAASGGSSGLVGSEPARYGSLHHPGDQYALDLFAQIGRALRVEPRSALGGLHPVHVVATGESQSAFYLTTFADALQPVAHTFDGLFIHSRGGAGAPLNGGSITARGGVADLRIRTDLAIPVFMFETQTDVVELGYASARQPDTAHIRAWEVAGTSHADAYLVGSAAGVLGCTSPVNDGPQHTVVQAAFAAFGRWVDQGTPPPSPMPFRLVSTTPAELALDPYGNVIGGVRTPSVDVPVSTLSGAAPAGTTALCSLFGSTNTFSPAMLVSLYHNKGSYLSRYTASLDRSIHQGFILPADRAALLADAQQVPLPG